jgi:L-alanine-DL-glutamate epimerase-like enolase superfamily enzyme
MMSIYKASIVKIEMYKLNISRSSPFRIALGTWTHVENILVRIHASSGLYGLGEGSPISYIVGETQAIDYEAAKALAQLLIGKNPLEIEQRLQELDAFLVRNPTIKSAFDMALYDLMGKTANLPLYTLLGGSKRTLYTDDTLGIDTPVAMAQAAQEVKRQGFPAIKVKLGTNRQDDVARIRAIRDVVGYEIPIRIDANQGWDPVTAVETLRELAQFDIQYCEEPVAHWNHQAMRRVREQSTIPIMADESLCDHHDAFRLASMGACDYFNIKLAKCGGIHNALKINAIAEGAGIQCMVGCMSETRLGISASAHLVSARPNIVFADLDGPFGHAEDPVIGGVTYDGGKVILPEAPGHGADIKEETLAKYERATISQDGAEHLS